MEYLTRLKHKVPMRRSIVVPVKHVMAALILLLKDVEIKEEDIPVHMHQVHATKKLFLSKVETPTVMIHFGNINVTKTLCLPI